jgi:hypothetical protein
MTGEMGLTEAQQKDYNTLLARFTDPKAKPLTDLQYQKMIDLETKSQNKELSQTAKSQCLKTFLAYKYGYYEEIHTDAMMKGKLLESEAIGLLNEFNGFYLKKNKERRSNDYISGECDIEGKKDDIYDIKICENIRTFFDVEDVSKNYFCQGQGYMNLWQKSNYKLTYVLMPDSEEMIERKISRLSFHLVGDDFEKAQKQLIHNNDIIKTMDVKDRIKIFEFDYDPEFMNQVFERVEVCREYIKTKYGY